MLTDMQSRSYQGIDAVVRTCSYSYAALVNLGLTRDRKLQASVNTLIEFGCLSDHETK